MKEKEKTKFKDIRKKLIAIIFLVITIFSNIQPIFALSSSGSGQWVAGQWDSQVYTTDGNGNVGMLLRRLVNYKTGERITVFCGEHFVNSTTGTIETATHSVPTDSKVKEACKVAYFGWYSKYGNYVIDGGIMAESMKSRKMDYVFTQQMIWETLGQSNATFKNSSIQSQYESFKSDINSKIATMKTRPSFVKETITIDAGQTKTLTDSNGVLKDYNSIDRTVDGVRIVHTKGENTMQVIVSKDCNIETLKITDNTMESWGMIKEETADNDTTVFFTFRSGVQNQLYALHYNDPVTMSLNLKINIFGKLEIAKKDNKGNFVPNTSFKISYNSDMSDDLGTYRTGANGKVTIDKLKPTTIYIQEVSVPKHLILDSTIKSTKINPAETTSFVATNNWKQGKIKVVKKDSETGKVVKQAGVAFDIYNSNNQKVTSITTNNEGVAISPLLDYANYFVKESKAPNKYTVQVKVSENIGVVENGKVYEISVLNTRVKGSISISKEDTETGKKAQGEATLIGAVYGLYAREDILDPADNGVIYKDNAKVGELVTDNNANASMNNLYLGKYFIKEIKESKGYTLDTTEYDFELNYENQNVNIVTKSLTVRERVISQAFRIIKVSSDDSGEAELLKGVEFTIKSQKDIDKYGSWEKAPIAKNYKGKETAILVTDEKGYAVSERLPFGKYVVRETKVPDNKYKVSDFIVEITKDSDEPQTWRIFNDKSFKSVIAIVKQDIDTQKTIKISGAKFKIKNIETGEYFGYWSWNPLPKYINSWTTDETGTVMTNEQLPAGKYQLEELSSPKGYLISNEPVEFEVTSNIAYETLPDGSTPVITIKQKDKAVKGKINAEKKGEVLVDFKDGKFIYEERGLANAKYEIYAREDVLDPANDGAVIYNKGKLVDTIITNADGKAVSKELPLGEYSVKECLAPENFILSDTIENVSLTYKDQNTSIVFDNASFTNERQKAEVNVYKKDKDDERLLANAEFSLYAKNDIINYKNEVIMKANDLIETATSDENGKATFKADLPLSQFLLKETKAPKGYIASDEIITIDAKYKGQDVRILNLEYEMKNEKMKGHIQVIKTSSEDNEYSKLPKGSPLENVVFEIYDSENNLVDKITTDKNGKVISKELVIGKYTIKEASSAKYYLLNEKIYDAEIVDDGTIDVNITNDNVDIDVEIKKEGFIETQNKDNIFYNFSDIKNNSNVPLDNFIWRDTLPTEAVRIDKIYTGTWNEDLEYAVYYKTNKTEEYKLFKDKLNTQKIYELNFNELKLAEDEYVTEYEFRFGKVKIGFREVESPILYCNMLDGLGNGFVFTNHTKVSGTYYDAYVEDTDDWTTITYFKEIEVTQKLPRTGC